MHHRPSLAQKIKQQSIQNTQLPLPLSLTTRTYSFASNPTDLFIKQLRRIHALVQVSKLITDANTLLLNATQKEIVQTIIFKNQRGSPKAKQLRERAQKYVEIVEKSTRYNNGYLNSQQYIQKEAKSKDIRNHSNNTPKKKRVNTSVSKTSHNKNTKPTDKSKPQQTTKQQQKSKPKIVSVKKLDSLNSSPFRSRPKAQVTDRSSSKQHNLTSISSKQNEFTSINSRNQQTSNSKHFQKMISQEQKNPKLVYKIAARPILSPKKNKNTQVSKPIQVDLRDLVSKTMQNTQQFNSMLRQLHHK